MHQYTSHHRRGFTLIELLVVICILAILVTFCFGGCNQGTGTRVGTINNVSKQGIVWKTNEGVMQVGGGVVGTAASEWKFSVPNNSAGIVEVLQGISDAGHRARVTYYKGFIAWPWKGNTTYYATDVKDLGAPGAPSLVVTPTAQ